VTFAADVVIGMDIGTTAAKAVVRSGSRHGARYVEQPTPWHTGSRGQTEIDPYRLVDVAVELIGRAVRAAESAWGPVRVRALGVAGMAEKCQPPTSGTTRLTSERFAKALRLGFILGAEPTVWPLCPSIAAATFHMVDAPMASEIRAGSKFSLD